MKKKHEQVSTPKPDIYEPAERPTCPDCGSKMNKKGHQVFASEPHKRRKYQCQECGKNIVASPVETEEEIKVDGDNENGNQS